MSSMTPLRSRPRRVSLLAMTSAEAITRPTTMSNTRRWRRRFPMSRVSALRREDDQQAAVLVVGREDVGYGIRGEVTLGVDGDALAERADPPLERGLDRIGDPVPVDVRALAAFAG